MQHYIFITLYMLRLLPSNTGMHSLTNIQVGRDTVKQSHIDTIQDSRHREHYLNEPDVIKIFSKHYVKDIAKPGDTNHRLYQQHSKKADAIQQKAFDDLVSKLKQYPKLAKVLKLRNADDIKGCKLKVLPVYYLTHNIAEYKNEPNLTPFFCLDTSQLTYTVQLGTKVIGILNFRKGESFVKKFTGSDSISYNHIIAMHKKPLAFIRNVFDEAARASIGFDNFGYISNGHIMFVFDSEGEYNQHNETDGSNKIVFIKQVTIKSAESYYLGSEYSHAMLPNIIKQGAHQLNSRERINKK